MLSPTESSFEEQAQVLRGLNRELRRQMRVSIAAQAESLRSLEGRLRRKMRLNPVQTLGGRANRVVISRGVLSRVSRHLAGVVGFAIAAARVATHGIPR
jgi:hypothetical protein